MLFSIALDLSGNAVLFAKSKVEADCDEMCRQSSTLGAAGRVRFQVAPTAPPVAKIENRVAVLRHS